MPQPIPCLAFDGNCADAMRFYAKVLGGKLDMMTFGQSPMAEQTPKSARNQIMHARLALEQRDNLEVDVRTDVLDDSANLRCGYFNELLHGSSC